MKPMGKRAVIYTRASLDVTGKHESVDRQETACRNTCAGRGYDVVAVKEDNAKSATTGVRPAWLELLGMVERDQVDVIVAWHLDRVTRSMLDLEVLIDLVDKRGVGLVTANGDIDLTNDTGRLVARILAAVARAEVERKTERQLLANDARAVKGLPYAGGPRAFGYKQNGMELEDAEAEAFRWAAQASLDGMSLRAIVEHFRTLDLKSTRAKHSKTGVGWTPSGVRRMLLNPRYAAIRVHRGEEVGPGLWPKLIDIETHLDLRRKLMDPARDPGRRWSKNSSKPQNLLTSIAKCGKCTTEESSQTVFAAAHGGIATYSCRSRKGCQYAPRVATDEAVVDAVCGMLANPAIHDALVPASNERAADANRQVDRLTKRLTVLGRQFGEGVFDDREEEYESLCSELRAKIKAERAVLAEVSEVRVFTDLAIGTEDVYEQWPDLPLERKRLIVGKLLDVTLMPVGRWPRADWDPEVHVVIKRRVSVPSA